MNEHLKELYYKAHDTSDIEGSFPQYFSASKFARLIIEECGNFTDPVTRKLMFKHFGIDNFTD